jgi:hypothetical protein
MPSLEVMQAFEARLAGWVSIGACPLVDANTVATTPAKPPYIELTFPVSRAQIVTPGVRFLERESGAARFVITEAAFAADWKARLLGWADEIRALFRAQTFAGVETFEASPASIDDRNKGGNTFSVAVVVTYKFDAIRP